MKIKNSTDLNKYLCGLIEDLDQGKANVETAAVISKVADKINKNNMNALLNRRQRDKHGDVDFFRRTQNETNTTTSN